jgi:hypothetical protein
MGELLRSLHALAEARGDGLRAEFLELLSCAAAMEADPALVDLAALRAGATLQSGPHPVSPLPDFLPGNVVDASDRFQRAANAHRLATKATTQG